MSYFIFQHSDTSMSSTGTSGFIQYCCAGCRKNVCDWSGPNHCIGQSKIPRKPVINGVCALHFPQQCSKLKESNIDCFGHQGGFPKDELMVRKKSEGDSFYESFFPENPYQNSMW
jgi:hypothetical protein